MTERELLDAWLTAAGIQDVENALNEFLTANPDTGFKPVGGRANNRGAIEVASDACRSAIERVTNMLDALLELEHERHSGTPDCRTPRQAASAWLDVPEKDGLAALTTRQRQDLAKQAVVELDPGEGAHSRIVTTTDQGIGIEPDSLEGTILSLNESNKIQKHYLAGTYGQGGSSTFAFCRYAVIVSRRYGSTRVGLTLVKYEDLPAEHFKTGRYVFLVKEGSPLEVMACDADIEHGTIVRHFGYDLTRYTSVIGPKSLYGMLGRILFDPVSSLRFENRVGLFNRTIKGARNALNGSVDEGDDTKGPSLDHHVPLFSVDLGDFGTIGIEYWVLSRSGSSKSKKRSKPANNFVDSAYPIILTHNGQNQGELPGRLVKDARDGADLPFLQTQGRLIGNVNCDRLSPHAKRLLFASTREQLREGQMLNRIKKEMVQALTTDDELVRLNEEARQQSLQERDEEADRKMRRQVAKLLQITGARLQGAGGTRETQNGSRRVRPGPPPRPPQPIEPKEPPTFVRIVWEKEGKVQFFAGQRRYIRLETDASSDYHDPNDAGGSRVNIAVGDDLRDQPAKGWSDAHWRRVPNQCCRGLGWVNQSRALS